MAAIDTGFVHSRFCEPGDTIGHPLPDSDNAVKSC